jgi:NlpC/P60 family protein
MSTSLRQLVIDVAARRKGIPYLFGAQGEGTNGLDCSLFLVLTYRDAGIPIGGARTAEQIRQACQQIALSEVQTGDILFFENTYAAAGPAGPDGRIASHAGIAIDSSRSQMWDCHASNDNTNLPGVGVTAINQYYWEPKLFDARRPPGLVGSGDGGAPPDPGQASEGHQYTVTAAGVRLRAAPGTSAQILVNDLGEGTIVTAVDKERTDADGYVWRHVKTASGTVGFVADEFIQRV